MRHPFRDTSTALIPHGIRSGSGPIRACSYERVGQADDDTTPNDVQKEVMPGRHDDECHATWVQHAEDFECATFETVGHYAHQQRPPKVQTGHRRVGIVKA